MAALAATLALGPAVTRPWWRPRRRLHPPPRSRCAPCLLRRS